MGRVSDSPARGYLQVPYSRLQSMAEYVLGHLRPT